MKQFELILLKDNKKFCYLYFDSLDNVSLYLNLFFGALLPSEFNRFDYLVRGLNYVK